MENDRRVGGDVSANERFRSDLRPVDVHLTLDFSHLFFCFVFCEQQIMTIELVQVGYFTVSVHRHRETRMGVVT